MLFRPSPALIRASHQSRRGCRNPQHLPSYPTPLPRHSTYTHSSVRQTSAARMPGLSVTVNDASPDILKQRAAIFDKLEAGASKQPEVLRDVSAPEYREMRAMGTNGFVVPPPVAAAEDIVIDARDNHKLALRVIRPSSGNSKGTFLHFHPGSLVYGSARGQDMYLLGLANALDMTAVSVEYRLAPEHPFPIPKNDAVDAALFALSPEGAETLGGPLYLIVGDSAGGYLAVWTAVSLRDDHGVDVSKTLRGILCSYGVYHPAGTPSTLTHTRNCIVSREQLKRCNAVAFKDPTDPAVSLLTAELSNMPPAFFLCGTADPAMDDSVLLATRWGLAGNKADLKLVPGGFHAFTLIPTGEIQKEGIGAMVQYAKSVL